MSQTIDWSDEYRIGLDEIDSQHKRLNDLGNKVIATCNRHQSQDMIVDSMDALKKYTTWHFQSEEVLMRIYEYPDYTDHRDEHVALIKELHEKIKEAKVSKPSP